MIRRRVFRLARFALGLSLLVVWLRDDAARRARLDLISLPEIDYLAEAARFRAARQYDEAQLVLAAGIEQADDAARPELVRALADTFAERHSLWRRAGDVARGAWTGRGDTPETLLGAMTTDFFVVGDVRDLTIQGANWATGREVDELIAGLSAVGVAATLAPQFDWIPSLLKSARKARALKPSFAARLLKWTRHAATRGDDANELRRTFENLATVRRRAGTGGVFRVLRCADEPADVAAAARFMERNADGAFALLTTGEDGLRLVARDADRAADVVRAAAKRGDAGARWLRRGAHRAWRPHPLLGLLKAGAKGHAGRAIEHLLRKLDRWGGLATPALAVWVFFETLLLGGYFARGRNAPPESPPAMKHCYIATGVSRA